MSKYFRECSWWERASARFFARQGDSRLPRHIAFIMDGNRRYARSQGARRPIEGHRRGLDSMTHIISWCQELGSVRQLTFYCFAINNFARAEEEVRDLLDLFIEGCREFLLPEEMAKIHERRISFRIFGDIRLFEPELAAALARLVHETARPDVEFYINLCLPYSARAELVTAIVELRAATNSGVLDPKAIDDRILSSALYSEDQPEPDILIRTSGEIRLSDFLLYQSAGAYIVYIPELWPDFSFWSFVRVLLDYQRQYCAIQEARTDARIRLKMANLIRKENEDECLERFSRWIRDKRLGRIEDIINRNAKAC